MVILLVLLLVLVLAGIGLVVKAAFVLAALVALIWLAGFLMRGPSARWYRW